MAIRREGRWLVPDGSAHCAFEVREGLWRLSLCPERLVSGSEAVAGLTIAEIAVRWSHLLWEGEDPNTRMVWGLIAAQAQKLGMDVLDAVLRCEAGEVPADAAGLGVA